MRKEHDLCTVEKCGRKHKSRGYCATHYQQFRRGVPIMLEIKARDSNPPEVCTEEGCENPVKAKGVCKMHHMRLLRHGHTKERVHPHKPRRFCTRAGCDNYYYGGGLCHQHYLRRRRLKEAHGLTLEVVDAMVVAQGGVCAICSGSPRDRDYRSDKLHDLCVDHDHRNGKIRGMLCAHCNRAIGLLKDDPVLVRLAAAYLEQHASA